MTLAILRAGRDLDMPMLSGRLGRRLRQGYGDVWRTWLKLDRECDFGWGLADINTEPSAESREAAMEFNIETWWSEVGSQLRRHLVNVVNRASTEEFVTRRERSKANKVINCLRLEVERIEWAFGGDS